MCTLPSALITTTPTTLSALCLTPSSPGDIGVSNIISPLEGEIITASMDVVVEIENFGTEAEKLFTVGYKKGGSLHSEQYAGDPIGSGQKVTYTFSQPTTPSLPGEQFCAWTNKQDDNKPANDTLCFGLHTATTIQGVDMSLSSITIFPNPVSGMMQLSIQSDQAQEAFLQVYNQLGQEQLLRQIQISQGISNHSIDFQQFAIGIYHVSLRTSAGELYNAKVVKLD